MKANEKKTNNTDNIIGRVDTFEQWNSSPSDDSASEQI
jgi:hypothetical protein